MFGAFRSPGLARLRLGAALLLWAVCLAAPARAGERGPQATQTPAALYHNYCSVCHGDKGDGKSRAQNSLKPAPRDFTSPAAAQDLTRDRMIAAVRSGRPNTAMVGWSSQLSDAQIVAVVDYVRNTFMRPTVTDETSRGRRIYARVCSVCHGDQGSGSMWASANLRPAPRDFSSPIAKVELTRDRMLAAVAQGRPNTAMQAYATKFSREDMEAVVDYIRTSIMRVEDDAGISGTHARGVPASASKPKKGAKAAAHDHGAHDHGSGGHGAGGVDHAAHGHATGATGKDGKIDVKQPFNNGLKGDAVAGRKFYEANCATCHGAKGDGQGPRAYFIQPKPANFLTPESREEFNRPNLVQRIADGSPGSEMPAWSKVLSQQEIANVAEYVFTAFIRPASAELPAGPAWEQKKNP